MRKMDEMEFAINQKGVKWSYAFVVLALAIWSAFGYIKGQGQTLPAMLLVLQYLVYFLVTSLEKRKMGDSNGKQHLLFALVTAVLLVVFGGFLMLAFGGQIK